MENSNRNIPNSRRLRVALLCSGVGRVQRGFERLFRDVYELLGEDLDVTLFKGAGPRSGGERAVLNASRDGWFSKVLPVHRLFGRSPYFTECWTYTLAVFPRLLRGRFDVVHCIDLPVGRLLGRLCRLLPASFKLLYTQGAVMDPKFYPPAHHIHQVAPGLMQDALDGGIDPARMSLVPCGIHASKFISPLGREEARRRRGVDPGAFVILSVNALNRVHKRVDWVVDELGALEGDFLYWCDGRVEDPTLLPYARERLGARFRHSTVPSEDVAELYRLADVLVLGSLEESFGLVVAEAMSAGLPVVVHDDAHFRWLVPPDRCRVDMRKPGALKGAVEELRRDPGERRRLGESLAEEAIRRFDWGNLKAGYLALYERALAGGPPAGRSG